MRILLMASLTLILGGGAAADELTDAGKKLFGDLVACDTLEYKNLLGFDLLGDRVLVQTQDSANGLLTVLVLDAQSHDELWSTERNGHYYCFPLHNRQPCPIQIPGADTEGKGVRKIYDLKGRLLYEDAWDTGDLASMPCSFVYESRPSEVEPGSSDLWVLSFEGERKILNSVRGSSWSAAAFNDSQLMVYTPSRLTLISVTNDSVVACNESSQFPVANNLPWLYASSCGNQAILTDYINTSHVNRDLELDWQHEGRVADVAFSVDGRFIAMVGRTGFPPDTGASYQVTLVRSGDGTEIWSSFFTSSQSVWSKPEWHCMSFAPGLLKISVPGSLRMAKESAGPKEIRTWLFSLDPESYALLDTLSVNGAVDLTTIHGETITYSATLESPDTIVVARWRR